MKTILKKAKRMLSLLLVLLMIVPMTVLLAVPVSAAQEKYKVEGGYIYFDPSTGTITDCDQSVTKADIPSQINGVSVTSIDSFAFSSCDSLTSINVDYNNNYFCDIDGVLFNKEKTELKCFPAGRTGSYVIPDGVTSIGDWAFQDCISLETVILSENVVSINYAAFFNCEKLADIYYSGTKHNWNKINIGDYNDILLNVTIHCADGDIKCEHIWGESRVENKPTCYFDGTGRRVCSICNFEEKYSIPANGHLFDDNGWKLTRIPCCYDYVGLEENVCLKCHSYSYREIPENKKIHYNHSKGVNGSYYYEQCDECGKYIKYSDISLCTAANYKFVLDNASGKLLYAFIRNYDDDSYRLDIPSNINGFTVKDIQDGTFVGNISKNTKLVTIPNSVVSIGVASFAETAIETIVMPDSVTCIGDFAFALCDELRDVYYTGSEEEWNRIDIGEYNTGLSSATIHFNYDPDKDDIANTIEYGNFTYLSSLETEWEYTYEYDDSWFYGTNDDYCHDLTKMSLRAAMAAGDIRTVEGMESAKGYENIKALMEDLDFDFSEEYSSYPEPDYYSIGYAIGSKDITSPDGEKSTLIMVTVRGSGYRAEWGSNFFLGYGTQHQGFEIAADQVLNGISNYVKANKANMQPDIKVWVMGYSRAAATTNLVAARLIDSDIYKENGAIEYIPGLDSDNVFAFCFECPQNTVDTNASSAVYADIVNIVNPIDIVPKVAMSDWNFTRYGTTYRLPSLETTALYPAIRLNMFEEYIKIAEASLDSYADVQEFLDTAMLEVAGQGSLFDRLVSDLAHSAKDRATYIDQYQATFMDLVGSTLGGADVELDAGSTIIKAIILILGMNPDKELFDAVSAAISSLMPAHYPELCLAWLESLDTLYADQNDSYTKVYLNCPIDVSVYDNNGNLTAQIIDNDVQEIDGGVAAYIDENGQKVVILPNDAEYTVEVTATDDGEMTYTVSEYNLDSGKPESVVTYSSIEISKGDQLQGTVDASQDIPEEKYILLSNEGETIEPTFSEEGGNVTEYIVSAISGEGGNAHGGGAFVIGEHCMLVATAQEGYIFDGWYVEDVMTSSENEYRFEVNEDITIEARFKKEAEHEHVWSEWEEGSSPDCTYDGWEYRYCYGCNLSEERVIPATGEHEWSEWEEVYPATEESEGEEYRYCYYCEQPEYRVIPKLEIVQYPVEGGYINFDKSTGSIIGYEGRIISADIPEVIDGVAVTSIADWSLYWCDRLTSVTIPESVTYIGELAFGECGQLKSIIIPSSVTNIHYRAFNWSDSLKSIEVDEDNDHYCDIDGVVFNKEKTELILCPEAKSGTYIIPDSVTSIGQYAFFSCQDITIIGIHDSVTIIGRGAFQSCASLKSITIPDGIETLSSTFGLCESLTSIIIPGSVTEIGWSTFDECYNLTDVYYHGTEKEWNQISISVNNDVLSNATIHFSNTGDSECEHPWSEWNIVIEAGCATNGEKSRTCLNCEFTESLPIFATGVHTYGEWIEITPSSCCYLGAERRSCNYCEAHEERELSTYGDHVWSEWFENYPATEESEGEEYRYCYYCEQPEYRVIPKIVIVKYPVDGGYLYFDISSGTITDCDESVTFTDIPDNIDGIAVTSIGDYAFSYCNSLKSITLPDGLTTIDENAFYYCEALESITIPDSVTSIGNCAFQGCESLCSIVIPDSVTHIDYCAFGYCKSLKFVILPKHLRSIDWYMFSGCEALTSISIPKNVASIADGAFEDCTNLTDVYYYGTEDEWSQISIGAENESLLNAMIHFSNDNQSECEHTWSEWNIVVEAGCVTDGKKKRVCSNCEFTENLPIFATGVHIYGEWVEFTPPTCFMRGTERRFCNYCEAYEEREIPTNEEHDLVNHEAQTATCTDNGWNAYETCTRCDYTTYVKIPKLGHNYSSNVIDPTCTEQGYTEYTCQNCSDTYKDTYIAATEHTYGGWAVSVEPTCVAEGSEFRACANCDATETKPIPATGEHIYGEWIVTTEPTVFENGVQTRKCENCDATETEELDKLEMTNPFTDVKDGKWYTEGVLWCYYSGYMAGTSETIFDYKGNVTRAMFVTILAQIDGSDISGYSKMSFSDVKPGKWYSNAIEWAASNGYAAGLGGGLFGYKQNVSREQIALFFYTYSEKNGIDVTKEADLSGYADLGKVHSWALDAMEWAVAKGLIGGTSETTLSPRDSATRAEIALIVKNYVENVKE